MLTKDLVRNKQHANYSIFCCPSAPSKPQPKADCQTGMLCVLLKMPFRLRQTKYRQELGYSNRRQTRTRQTHTLEPDAHRPEWQLTTRIFFSQTRDVRVGLPELNDWPFCNLLIDIIGGPWRSRRTNPLNFDNWTASVPSIFHRPNLTKGVMELVQLWCKFTRTIHVFSQIT